MSALLLLACLQAAAPAPIQLSSGVATPLQLVAGSARGRVQIPANAAGLSLATADSSADVRLFVKFGGAPDPDSGDYDLASEDLWHEERLYITERDSIPLESGMCHVLVMAVGGEDAATTLTATVLKPRMYTAAVGVPLSIELTRAHGLAAEVEVPLPAVVGEAAERAWLVEVECPNADVDVEVLPVGRRGLFAEPYGFSNGLLGYERFVCTVPRAAQRVAVRVAGFPEIDFAERLPVRVLVQALEPPGRVPTRDLCPTPRLSAPDVPLAVAPFDRAARATVVVFGPLGAGSGVVVSPDGLVLTCAHVVAGADRPAPPLFEGDAARPPLAVGFTHDPVEPPWPTFGARLVEYREDLDLALIAIEGDLLGRPLPAQLGALPHVLPAARAPRLGERLVGFGYPGSGGTASMVSLTMTGGLCAGYSREAEGVLLKTDAAVHAGVSGGAFLNQEGQLLGIAVSSVNDGNAGGSIGYIAPLALLPEAWRARLGW